MSWEHRFIELDKLQHERSTFDCGEVELNRFIKTQAAKHMQLGVSRTLVLPQKHASPNGILPICAFYSISVSSICRQHLPQNIAKKLPHYPIPVFVLAQLAVHKLYHQQGLGKIALVTALRHFLAIQVHMRAYAVVVDCLNEKAQNFYSQYGFEVLCVHRGRTRMFLPMAVVVKLFQTS